MGPLIAAAGLSALTGVAGAISKFAIAADQRKRAGDLREEAKRVAAPDIAKQYLEADAIKQWQAIHGMPGSELAKQDLDANTADATQAVQTSSGSGANTLAAISSIYGNKNRSVNDINSKDAQYKYDAASAVAASKMQLGHVADRNQAIKRDEQDKIRQAANQLENASTANNMSGTSSVISSLGGGAASALGATAAEGDGTTSTPTPEKQGNVGLISGALNGVSPNTTTTAAQPVVNSSNQPSVTFSQVDPTVADGYSLALKSMGRKGAPVQANPAMADADDLRRLQQHLNSKGLYTGTIDGAYNQELEDALKNFNAGPVNTNLGYVAPLYRTAY